MKHGNAETQRAFGDSSEPPSLDIDSARDAKHPRVAAIILAAGEARRFGQPKLLMPWGAGTILQSVLRAALAAPVEPVALVLGAHAEEIEASLGAEWARLQIVHNPLWQTGQSSSVRAGLAALQPSPDAALFVMADQPNITPKLIGRLIAKWQRTGALIVAPAHRDQRSSPVLFDRTLFAELMAVTGDQGGRPVIAKHLDKLTTVEVADSGLLRDIDTPEDYAEGNQPRRPET
jgi:molybdenum cofactor cytidylyltransferase